MIGRWVARLDWTFRWVDGPADAQPGETVEHVTGRALDELLALEAEHREVRS